MGGRGGEERAGGSLDGSSGPSFSENQTHSVGCRRDPRHGGSLFWPGESVTAPSPVRRATFLHL